VNHDDCERVTRLASGWSIGALDPEEAAELRTHVASCRREHPELRAALALAAAIGAAMPDEDLPSPSLRARLLSEVGGRPLSTAPVTTGGAPPPWRVVAAAAGALALAASLVLAVQLGENHALRDRVEQLDGRLTAIASDLDRARAWIDRAVARGATAYFMAGEGEARQASFMLVVEPENSGAVLLMSGLPALPADEAYELWVERDGAIVGIGTFRPDEGGLAALTIDASLTGIRQAMITVEPEGGSNQPSGGGVIMQGELSL
jgi:anti-sigma-K factor RskA